MGLKGFVKKQAKKGLNAAVPGKGASLKGAAKKIDQRTGHVGSKGFGTISGLRGVTKVTKELNKNQRQRH